jgi:hypothetical protein
MSTVRGHLHSVHTRLAEHHIAKAKHHEKLAKAYRQFHKAMGDENDGMDQFQEVADAHDEISSEHADCAQFHIDCAKACGDESATKAAGMNGSADRRELAPDNISGVTPPPNVRAIPRHGAPEVRDRSDVPAEFEKLVSTEDDTVLQ